jgi:transcriptional regulator with XRE-family HTH domain
MGFAELLERLLSEVRGRIHNGELTERGLARRVGLSQSHIHNVLCGLRVLTPSTADRVLDGLGLSVLDLIDQRRLERSRGRRGGQPTLRRC